jgi:hypothetical protein
MITWVRTNQAAPGKIGEFFTFAKEIAAYIKSTHGVDVKVMQQDGGAVGRVCWMAEYKNHAAYEEATTKITADPGYHKFLARLPGLVSHPARDSLWRSL